MERERQRQRWRERTWSAATTTGSRLLKVKLDKRVGVIELALAHRDEHRQRRHEGVVIYVRYLFCTQLTQARCCHVGRTCECFVCMRSIYHEGIVVYIWCVFCAQFTQECCCVGRTCLCHECVCVCVQRVPNEISCTYDIVLVPRHTCFVCVWCARNVGTHAQK